MTRDEFLSGVRRETGFMLPDERHFIYEYFRDRFAGRNEESVISELGDPKSAVKALINDYSGKRLNRPMRILVIIASVIAAPAVLDAAIVIAAIILALLAAAAVLLAVLPFAGVALWMGGIDSIIRAFVDSLPAADIICRMGAGLLSAGAGVFILLLVYKTYNRFIPWAAREIAAASGKLARWMKKTIQRVIA